MSEASFPHCDECNEPLYACRCNAYRCDCCGGELDEEEIAIGRESCFECYCEHQGGIDASFATMRWPAAKEQIP
jgi:hypothetical protein